MKIKYLIIVGLVLAILTIGAVSASQDADNLTADDAQGDSVLETPEDEGALADPDDYCRVTVDNITLKDAEYNEYDPDHFVVEFESDATGNFSAYFDDETTPYRQGQVSDDIEIDLNGKYFSYGPHKFIINYTGDSKYDPFVKSYDFNVNMHINYYNYYDDLLYGTEQTVIIEAYTDDIAGNFTLLMNDKIYPFVKEYNVWSIYYVATLSEYNLGRNDYTIVLSNDSKYKNQSFNGYFNTYAKVLLFNDWHFAYNDGNYAYLYLPSNATGNLTVKVDDKEFANKKLVNGKANISLDGIAVGTHRIYAGYSGSDYAPDYFVKDYVEIQPRVSIPKYAYTGYGNYTINVTVEENANGTLKVFVNGDELFNNKTNGTRIFSMPINSTYGYDGVNIEYEIGTYTFSDYYTIGFSDENPIWQMEIRYPSNVLQGDTYHIDVNYPYYYGNFDFNIYIDGKRFYGGYAGYDYYQFDTSSLSIGPHEFTIEAIDNDGYFIPQSKSGSFNVTLVMYSIEDEITREDDYYWSDIYVHLKDDATGNISAYLDGNTSPFYMEDVDYYGNCISFDGMYLSYGPHKILINYSGDSKYPEVSREFDFNVTYYVDYGVHSYSICWGDNVTVELNDPDDITGDVTLQINGKTFPFVSKYYGGSTYYICEFNEYNLGENNYTITISNDPKYPNKSIEGQFYVDARIVLEHDMEYNDGTSVSLSLPKNATGNLTVLVDGKVFANVPLVEGKAAVSLNSLSVGIYDIYANYTGDDYAVGSIGNQFAVKPYVDVPRYVYRYGGNYTLTIALGENATGNLTVNVNSNEIFNNKTNGTLTFSLAPENAGIEVRYDYGGGIELPLTFYVDVRDEWPEWEMNVTTHESSAIKGNYYEIVVDYPHSGNIELILYVDGKQFVGNYQQWYSYLEFDTSDLSFGPHEFTIVAVDRDGYFISQNKSGSFNVSVAEFYVPDVVEYPSGSTYISTYFAENVTGTLRVLIDGKDYAMEFVDSFNIDIDLEGISCGVHDYEIIYSGNAPQKSQKGKFNVTYDFHINVASEYPYGAVLNLYPYMPGDATGTITLKVGNKTYTSKLNDGSVAFDLGNLEIGEYNATFTYNGDDRYNYPQSANKTIKISGYEVAGPDSNIVYWGNDENITLALPKNATGNLTVFVDGKVFESIKVESGIAKVSLKTLPFGKHNVTANYTGEDYTVKPYKVTDNRFAVYAFAMHSDSFTLAENGWISAILPSDAKGNITITFDNNDTAAINVTPSQIRNYTFVFKKLGTHTFTLKYTGDDYAMEFPGEYYGLFHFEVLPNEIVDPEENGGNDIALTLPEDANGTLSVYSYDYGVGEFKLVGKVNVNGPQAKYTLTGFTEYQFVEFQYVDKKYGTFTQYFDYYPTTKIAITGSGNDKTAVFNFELPKNATGSLIIKINGEFYTKDLVGGKASLTINNLASGTYPVEVTYSGDKSYAKGAETSNVTISSSGPTPVPVKIVAKDVTSIYTDGAKFTVTVYGEDGALAKNADVIFMVNGKKVGSAKTNDKGVAIYKVVQVPGTYKISAQALGKTITKKLTVKHVLKLQKVKVKRSAKKLVIKATLVKVNGKFLKGKKVTLKFNGKKYTAKAGKKGVVKFTIKSKALKKLKIGKKVTYQATYLKDTVKYTVKVKK